MRASAVVAQGLTRALERGLGNCGSRAQWRVAFSWIRDGTHVPCIGRQILNHWTTLTGCVTLEKDLDISVPLGKILLMASNGHQLDIPLAKKEFFFKL